MPKEAGTLLRLTPSRSPLLVTAADLILNKLTIVFIFTLLLSPSLCSSYTGGGLLLSVPLVFSTP